MRKHEAERCGAFDISGGLSENARAEAFWAYAVPSLASATRHGMPVAHRSRPGPLKSGTANDLPWHQP